MMQNIVLANSRLILKNEVIHGSLRMKDGIITDIDHGAAVPTGAIDMQGDFVAPGLVELHTDNLERHLTPRPKVDWPHRAAIIAHDRELAGTGITTVFDALRVGSITSDASRPKKKYARKVADEILEMRNAGALRISHHIHLRAETCSETLVEELAEFGQVDRIGIVSMMDHTPGQRQFCDLEKYKILVCGKHGLDPAEFEDYVVFLRELYRRFGRQHEAATVAAAAKYGATLASHDDTTAAQVATSHGYGVKIAEFPTTLEAAGACHQHNIATVMGAPNLIRGGSHSGNVAAHELAKRDQLDILSSDYIPAALLMAALHLGELWGDTARGMATVTQNPAHMAGLNDRGTLEIGNRADVVRFDVLENTPVLKETWSAGHRVF